MIFHIFHILVAQFWFIFCSALYIHPTLISSMRDWGSNSLAICQVGSRLSNQPGRDWTSVCQRLKFNGLRVVLAALREPTNGSIRKNPVVVTVHFDVLHMEVQIVYPWVPTNWWQDQTCLWQRCDMILLARRFKGDLKRFYHTVRINESYVVCSKLCSKRYYNGIIMSLVGPDLFVAIVQKKGWNLLNLIVFQTSRLQGPRRGKSCTLRPSRSTQNQGENQSLWRSIDLFVCRRSSNRCQDKLRLLNFWRCSTGSSWIFQIQSSIRHILHRRLH